MVGSEAGPDVSPTAERSPATLSPMAAVSRGARASGVAMRHEGVANGPMALQAYRAAAEKTRSTPKGWLLSAQRRVENKKPRHHWRGFRLYTSGITTGATASGGC